MNLPEGWPTEEMLDNVYDAYRVATKHPRFAFGDAIKTLLAAAPTPPAQDDEPVAWLIPRIIRMPGTGNEAIDGTVAWEACVFCDTRTRARIDKNGSEFYPKPLYTRQDEKLRKAAEELLRTLDATYIGCSAKDDMENLRAALEGK